MTEHTASIPTFGGPSSRTRRPLQGIEHGYIQRPARHETFSLWKWFSAELEHNGRRASRDSDRAYRDLQAVRDRSEW
ncbi:hypothetical protein HII28_15455 [Planctomonas sp. JC2975]|uniref:hypothetical protein n=1 Tax=Planctomonas sp. JC2975 TaxID=2729626 RepID=UPI00147399F3|nr:hypothetical protein [Planctomonas sp. JC2975]NNC13269.1 hypothetical protein [Planctomonas sp. JC2975]